MLSRPQCCCEPRPFAAGDTARQRARDGATEAPFSDAAKNLLRAVIDNGRLAALPEIASQFQALVNAKSGISDAVIHSATLTVPHPRITERAFVLVPLLELAPAIHIPGRGPAAHYAAGVADQGIRPLS